MSMFDIAGIQDFVFATKKAKENVGASSLLRSVFERFLIDELRKIFPEAATDWNNAGEFGMLSDNPPPAEIVYIGGGNALVAFREEEDAIALTRAFSHRVLVETGGLLSVAVAHHETNAADFINDMKIVMQKLARRKFNLPHSMPLLGLAVTREGASDGFPAVKRGKGGEWISEPASQKRDVAEATAASDALSTFAPEGFAFPVEFDKLGRNKEGGESLLAVVHIDGNNMGTIINEYIEDGDGSYRDAVWRMRKMSARISGAYERTLRETVSLLASGETLNALQEEGVVLEENTLPFRPLICAGDDVTFVCDGRIAFFLTEAFLERLSQEKTPDGQEFAACAGIAVVKPHFPFYRAYRLSEELCESAKMRAKENAPEHAGSWLDYEIVYSGLPLDLHAYRTQKYSIPGLKPFKDKKISPKYHLLWRPYFVAGSVKDDPSAAEHAWSGAMQRLRQVKGADGKGREWPRSKLKGLREALTMSKDDAKDFCDECKSRGNCLEDDLFTGDRTKWFDVIDMLDVHIDVPALRKEGDED